MTHEQHLGHGDIEAALATRRELGARYDAELVDGFAERIERVVDARVADQVALGIDLPATRGPDTLREGLPGPWQR